MIPDAEHIVTAALAGINVVGTTPTNTDHAWVRLTQLDAPTDPVSGIDHFIEFYFQADCYAGAGGGHAEASTLARTVREALMALPSTATGAVVTRTQINGHSRIPDTDFEPARQRFILTFSVWMHA